VTSAVANRMRLIREARNLSRDEVARRLKTTRMRIWRLEKGDTKILADDVPRIARALRTSILALYGRKAA
jgi:transcriptional regulator with XRE-family HTH domain